MISIDKEQNCELRNKECRLRDRWVDTRRVGRIGHMSSHSPLGAIAWSEHLILMTALLNTTNIWQVPHSSRVDVRAFNLKRGLS